MNQYEPETKFLPVAPTSNGSQSKEELDRAGQAVVLIIGKAAEAATSRADQARDVAQKLSRS